MDFKISKFVLTNIFFGVKINIFNYSFIILIASCNFKMPYLNLSFRIIFMDFKISKFVFDNIFLKVRFNIFNYSFIIFNSII